MTHYKINQGVLTIFEPTHVNMSIIYQSNTSISI